MTGLHNGLVLKWRNHSVIKSFQCGNIGPLVKTVGDEIIVAAINTLVILDSNLELVKKLTPIDGRPLALDATPTYIAYGTHKGSVAFYNRHLSIEPTVSLKIKILFLCF